MISEDDIIEESCAVSLTMGRLWRSSTLKSHVSMGATQVSHSVSPAVGEHNRQTCPSLRDTNLSQLKRGLHLTSLPL